VSLHLAELIARYPRRPAHQVPAWMMGLWRRHIISFADGSSDTDTQVFWLQSRNFSIDLRLPRPADIVPGGVPLTFRSPGQWRVIANYEGWVAHSRWDGAQLSWSDPTAYQFDDRWPEPAPLQRIGNCMLEVAPSGAYAEDWRLQASADGPLVGLRLIEEVDLRTGRQRHVGGGLIVSGDFAGLVLGRADPRKEPGSLEQAVLAAQSQPEALARLLGFEASIACGALDRGFEVTHSTVPGRPGTMLFPLDGFAFQADGTVIQEIRQGDAVCLRRFTVDTIEPSVSWPLSTPQAPSGAAWMARHAGTLGRYLRTLE